MSRDGDGKHADPRGEGTALIGLLRRYVIQETLDPLKSAGRTVLFGSAAALLLGIGAVLLLLGVLRVLQTETGTTFAGNLSWLPYVITAAAGLVLVGLAGFVLLRSGGSREKKTNRGSKNRSEVK